MYDPPVTVPATGAATASGAAPAPRLVVATAATLGAFVALAVAVRVDLPPLRRADEAVSAALHDLGAHSPGWVAALEWLTLLGNRWLWVVGGGALAAYLVLRRDWSRGSFVAATCLAPGLAPLTAGLVRRDRPATALVETDGFGHPSGHALTVAVLATTLLVLAWPHLGRAARRWSLAGAVLLALLVGVTRVGLVVHYPTDVVGGWLLGVGIVLLVLSLTQLVYHRWPRGR